MSTKCFNSFLEKPWFLCVCSTRSFENSVGKGKTALDEQFLLFPQCFLLVLNTFVRFHQNLIMSANAFSLEESKFDTRERIKTFSIWSLTLIKTSVSFV